MKEILGPSFFIGNHNDDIISFGPGEPDLISIEHPPLSLKRRGYGEVQGEEDLRSALSCRYPGSSPDNFIITNGASEALDLSLRAIYTPHAKILIPRPYYSSYLDCVELSHMDNVFLELQDGRMIEDDIEKAIDGCIGMIFNSPGNPTGIVQSSSVMDKIEKLSQERKKYIISDDVYEDFDYSGPHRQLKGEYIISIHSFSKSFDMCGHRVGYIYATNKELIEKIVRIKACTSMNTNLLAQDFACQVLETDKEKMVTQSQEMEKKGLYMYERLKDLGLELWKPEGAFYLFPKMEDSSRVVSELYYDYGVIVYDGKWFGAPNRIRLSFATSRENIDKGLEKLGCYLNR